MLRFGIMLLFLGSTVSVFAQTGFKLSGKLRVLNPTEIRVETINGESLLSERFPPGAGKSSRICISYGSGLRDRRCT